MDLIESLVVAGPKEEIEEKLEDYKAKREQSEEEPESS